MKNNRIASFAIMFVIYLAATIVGIASYKMLPYSWWLNLLLADVIATVFTFILSVLFKNASVYDPYWSVQPIVIVFAYAFIGRLSIVTILPIVAITIWGVRLTANWAYTFHGLNHQDWRYTMLHEKTGVFYPVINFIGIHMVPTLVVYGCTLPAVYLLLNDVAFNPLSIIFFCVSIAAVVIQGTADIQMHKYRKNRTTPFVRTGLWKHGRHPNYLGEISMWWGIGLFAVTNCPDAWWLLSGALANTILFLAVSVPMADGRQSKKEGFAEYKKQTRMFI